MPMLYDYSGPGAFTPVPVCPSSGPAEGPLIRLESLCHFDAVSTYRVIRDGLPELLFAYTQGGEGRLTYQGVAHTLRRGDAFLVDCRDWHRYETAGEHWDFLWMHLSGELAFSFARYIWERRGPVVSGGPAFAAGWQAVLELVRHNDPRAEAAVSAAVYQLLSLFLLPRGMDERIEQAAAYMQEHCAEPLPVEALARLACMSPYHFQRRFKEETGLTVHQYLNRQRVGRAKQLFRQLPPGRRVQSHDRPGAPGLPPPAVSGKPQGKYIPKNQSIFLSFRPPVGYTGSARPVQAKYMPSI